MFGRIFILMIFTFLLEGWILIRMVAETSFLFTFLLCLFTSFLGLSLMRGAVGRLHEGTQRAMAGAGSIPEAVSGGFIQLLAGFLLLLPGVLSDIVGVLLMLPPFHHMALKRASASQFVRDGQFSNLPFGAQFSEFRGGPAPQTQTTSRPADAQTSTPFRDPDAPPADDNYVPPKASAPDNVIIDAQIIDES